MPITIRPQAPQPQCCVCYCSDPAQLTQVCANCGQALCLQHSQATLRSRFLGWLDFGGINRQVRAGQPPAYCPTCCNRRFALRELWRNLLLAARLLWLPVGAADFQWPALATAPAVALTLQEELSGTIHLDEKGTYQPSPPAATTNGKLLVKAFFTARDRERMQAYRRRYHLPTGRAIAFRAGFLRLEQMANLELKNATTILPLNDHLILSSSSTTDLSPWAQAKTMSSKERGFNFEYTVRRRDTQAMPLPVQLVATFVPEAEAHSIELRVQLRSDIKRWMNLEAAFIDRLELNFPQELGDVYHVSPKPVTPVKQPHTTSYPPPQLVWEDAGVLKLAEPATSFHLQLGQPPTDPITLRGTLQLTCMGLFSQQESVALFYAWGAAHPEKLEVQRQTKVAIDFQLTLDPTWLQHPYKLDPHDHHRWEGLAPDDDFVQALLGQLTAAKLYVRVVTENQPHVSPTHANATRRLWELAGRHYDGLVPLDFHIELAGEVGSFHPQNSFLRADVTVQVPAPKLRDKAQKLYDLLMEQITTQVEQYKKAQEEKAKQSTNPPTFTEAAKTTVEMVSLLVKSLQDLADSNGLTTPPDK